MIIEPTPNGASSIQSAELISLFEHYCSVKRHPFRNAKVQTVEYTLHEWCDVAAQLVVVAEQQNLVGTARHLKSEDITRAAAPFFTVSDNHVLLVRAVKSTGTWVAVDSAGSETSIDLDKQAIFESFTLRIKSSNSHNAGSIFGMLRKQVERNKRVIFEAVFATFMISVIGLSAAMYTMQVYDRVLSVNGFSTLWVLTIGVIVAILFEFLLKQARAFIVGHTAKNIDLQVGNEIFERALDIRLDSRPPTVGTFAGQIRQFDAVRNFLTSSTLFVLADVPFGLFFIFVIYTIAGPVALVPLVMVPLAILLGLSFQKPIEWLTEKHMRESNIKNGMVIEAIDGIETLKSLGSEWVASKKYQELSDQISESEIELKLLSAKATNLTQVIQQCNYVGIVAVGAYLISMGDLSVGGLIACTIIAGRALAPLSQIPQLLTQWKQIKIALNALDNALKRPSDNGGIQRKLLPSKCRGEIAFENIQFAYDGDNPALNIHDIVFHEGEKIAIVGPIGSGKSTLLKIVAGLYHPSSGSLKIDGIDVSKIYPDYIRENIIYLPQDIRLFNGSLRENLILGVGNIADDKIIEAAQQTGLDSIINAHSEGLDLNITEGGLGLSGGQRQIVGLTRLILMSPKVVLLDEPTASMDGHTESKVIDLLFNVFAKDVSIIVVTHKTALLPKVQRILVLDKGSVVLDGSSKEILAKLSKQRVAR
jgi:ATP-binding cassette subfamily C protein LapB